MKEIWKDIPKYEGVYLVSNLGRVKRIYFKTSRILKPGLTKQGYPMVVLSIHNIRRTFAVHKLVAITFLNHTPCGNKLVIDHINGIKTDNRIINLQELTQRDNVTRNPIGKSKYRGVSFNKRDNRWVSNIKHNGKRISLGSFKTEIEASEAYENKLKTILKSRLNNY